METLPNYISDYIFLTINAGENSKAREEELKSNGVWKNLPAVKENRRL
ncbi:ABC transporter substrate-binding protein [Paenibacillus sp. N3.4]|nr:ABC transporter substrate-binding protein [Paenibacillus sp. N3.4]